ncbi:MAG: hypothetical protein AAF709_01815 [Pseudomonadota bacterium]
MLLRYFQILVAIAIVLFVAGSPARAQPSSPEYSAGHGVVRSTKRAEEEMLSHYARAGVPPPFSIGHGVLQSDYASLPSNSAGSVLLNAPPFSIGHGILKHAFHADVSLLAKLGSRLRSILKSDVCKYRSSRTPDFWFTNELGMPSDSVFYTFDTKEAEQRLSEEAPKVVLHHGPIKLKPSWKFHAWKERVNLYVGSQSMLTSLNIREFQAMLKDRSGRKSIVYPNLPSRKQALELALGNILPGVKLDDAIGVPPLYDCLAALLEADSRLIGLGLRGSAIKKFKLRRVEVIGESARRKDSGDNPLSNEVSLTVSLKAITNQKYGRIGEEFLQIHKKTLKLRSAE